MEQTCTATCIGGPSPWKVWIMDSGTHPSQRQPASARQNPTSGVLALIMGILGLTAVPLIGSILALVFGHQSRNEAADRPDVYVDDLGRVGRVLGWVGVGLAVLGLLAAVAAFLFLMPMRMG